MELASELENDSGLTRRRLRPYQQEVAVAVLDSVFGRKGLTFSVEIARQGGKNELSAQLELLLLTLYMERGGNIVKCSPTFRPQAAVSMRRLKDRLNDAGFLHNWQNEGGYVIRLGNARAIFLSAEESASVVGNTSDILLEVDESQDVGREKYSKEFRPMAATTNATTVHYGTTWDDATLLEEVKQSNLELEKRDGQKRHFSFDWREVARFNPDYAAYVEGERLRLGEEHPLFRTQYRLLPIRGGGGFRSAGQRAQLAGRHRRRHQPLKGHHYVAGIDLAGESEEGAGEALRRAKPRQDSTVVTIADVDLAGDEPTLRVVEHYRWTGRKHSDLYPQLVDLLRDVWGCRRVVVDATGVGQPVASFLRQALGARVEPFTFTAQSKSRLGFELLATINSGRLKTYAADGSDEHQAFWQEMEMAKSHYRPNQTMNFYVETHRGHDDFLMSLALVVEAGKWRSRAARGRGY